MRYSVVKSALYHGKWRIWDNVNMTYIGKAMGYGQAQRLAGELGGTNVGSR